MVSKRKPRPKRVVRREPGQDGYAIIIGGNTLCFRDDWEPGAIKCKRQVTYTLIGDPIPYGG